MLRLAVMTDEQTVHIDSSLTDINRQLASGACASTETSWPLFKLARTMSVLAIVMVPVVHGVLVKSDFAESGTIPLKMVDSTMKLWLLGVKNADYRLWTPESSPR